MEVMGIPGLFGNAAEKYGPANREQRAARKEDQGQPGVNGNKPNRDNLNPEDLHNAGNIDQKTVIRHLGISLDQARSILCEISPKIAGMHPARLAEIQPAADKTLFPGAYV